MLSRDQSSSSGRMTSLLEVRKGPGITPVVPFDVVDDSGRTERAKRFSLGCTSPMPSLQTGFITNAMIGNAAVRH